jgi:hypothetical protein
MKLPSLFHCSERQGSVFVNNIALVIRPVRISIAGMVLAKKEVSMSETSEVKKVCAAKDETECAETTMFYCEGHYDSEDYTKHYGKIGFYVRAYSYYDAFMLMVDRCDEVKDMDRHEPYAFNIKIVVVPSAEGTCGVIEWDAVESRWPG